MRGRTTPPRGSGFKWTPEADAARRGAQRRRQPDRHEKSQAALAADPPLVLVCLDRPCRPPRAHRLAPHDGARGGTRKLRSRACHWLRPTLRSRRDDDRTRYCFLPLDGYLCTSPITRYPCVERPRSGVSMKRDRVAAAVFYISPNGVQEVGIRRCVAIRVHL